MEGRASANWVVLTALAATVAAMAAVAMAWMTLSELRRQGQEARSAAGIESVWRFVDEWAGPDMLAVRSAAAASLLAEEPEPEVAEVLGFFDEIAFLVERGLLDEEFVSYEFYWPMANYWAASGRYVLQAQREDPASWKHLSRLMPRLAEIEQQRRGLGSAVPTPAQVQAFLELEASGPECTEDDGTEVRRLPFRPLRVLDSGNRSPAAWEPVVAVQFDIGFDLGTPIRVKGVGQPRSLSEKRRGHPSTGSG